MNEYTVIGLYVDGDVLVAGVIEGSHPVSGGNWGDEGPWATTVMADSIEEAETLAVAEIVALGRDDEDEEDDEDERYFVVEGDDHEQRIILAADAEDALESARAGFEAQYGQTYAADLLNVLGDFDSEDDAQASHPGATL
jgi:hypothetical protein